jgi:hypothetical protein
MLDVAQGANPTSLIIPVLLFLCVLVACLTIFICLTWNVEPWTRKYLKPRSQLRADRYRVRIWKLRAANPEAFAAKSPWQEQHLEMHGVEELAAEVVEHDTQQGSTP